MSFFPDVETIRYRGPESTDPLAFRYYDADAEVLGKTMAEHLRFAVCYWHSFDAPGSDVFGTGTWDRPGPTAARTRCQRRGRSSRPASSSSPS